MLRLLRDASFHYFSAGFLAVGLGFLTLYPGSVGRVIELVTGLAA